VPHTLDEQNMEAVIGQSAKQFTDGLDAAAEVDLPKGEFRLVVVAGMGGSSMPGALVDEAGLNAVPIRLHQNYDLPGGLDPKDTLIVASSYSGNTEETLSSYDEARGGGFAVIGISHGGQLQKKCQADGVPFVQIPAEPPDMQPRSATGYGVGILTQVLARLGLAVDGAADRIRDLRGQLEARMSDAQEIGTEIAAKLKDATPAVYATEQYANVARIWKIKFNENAKTPAFWNFLPEMNHNETIGWTDRHGPFHLLFLSDPDDDPRNLKRQRISQQVFEEKGLHSTTVPMEGGDKVEKMFSTLLVGDWASWALALELGHNPTPVPLVEEFKARMKGG